MSTVRPLTYTGVRLHMRAALHKKNYGILAVNRMVAGLDDPTIDSVAQAVPGAWDALTAIGSAPASVPSTPAAPASQPVLVGAEVFGAAAGTPGPLETILEELVTGIENFFATPAGQTLESALVTAAVTFLGTL